MKSRWLFGAAAVAGAAAGAAVVRARRSAWESAERARRLQQAKAEHGRNIVILGAGFAGINAADCLVKKLPAESGWKVTLVDRHNYHLFTPLLYHAASGLVDPSSILFPVRRLTDRPHFQFREASVQAIDMHRQVVHLDDGPLAYDQLVIALGSVTNFFGSEEKLPGALKLKTLADSIMIRNHVIDAFEKAEVETDPEIRRRHLTFVVVGGGATGVELIGSIRGLVRGTLAEQYRRIDPSEVKLILLEAMPEILPGISRELAEHALQRMRDLEIDVRLETKVEAVEDGCVVLASGESIPADTVVWAAGVRPAPLAARLELPKDRKGRLQVDDFLQVEGVPNVYALGDIAAVTDPQTEKTLPPTAAVAVQEGKALAEILVARLENRAPKPFRYEHRGELISLGRHEAVAEVMGVRFTGFPAWLMWRAFYLSQLMGFKNQLAVALDWSFAYAYQRDAVRLDLPMRRALTDEGEAALDEQRDRLERAEKEPEAAGSAH
ncbi:MAG: NAD(P)/FAD-dependent oxidoreductase [Armatimonadota bacterium]